MAATPSIEDSDDVDKSRVKQINTHDFGFLPIPKRLRYNIDVPFHFGWSLNVAFGLASTFICANMYYCQPLLIQFAESFEVTHHQVSRIPTLVQAGYATGLLLISPLGDLVRRRQLILTLIILSTSFTFALAFTPNLRIFEAFSFLVGLISVTPQILLPLAVDLAPPERRATAISVVISGLLFGALIARLFSGIIAEFTTWRVVYYFAIGVQSCVFLGSYFIVPDYPAKNEGLTYKHILWTTVKFGVTEPVLIQTSLLNLALSACYANFWVTLTFLLGGPPYSYSTLVIGLFGLIGMLGVALGPFVGRVIDKLVPWYAALISAVLLCCFQAIQTAAGGIHVAAIVIASVGLDVFTQTLQVSMLSSVFSIAAEARSRFNAVMILSIYIGQVIGTSVGTEIFINHGWRAGAALSLGLYVLQVVILLARGPGCTRFQWIGWKGGAGKMRKLNHMPPSTQELEAEEGCIGKEEKKESTTDVIALRIDAGQYPQGDGEKEHEAS